MKIRNTIISLIIVMSTLLLSGCLGPKSLSEDIVSKWEVIGVDGVTVNEGEWFEFYDDDTLKYSATGSNSPRNITKGTYHLSKGGKISINFSIAGLFGAEELEIEGLVSIVDDSLILNSYNGVTLEFVRKDKFKLF
jgi:hypothetical protein